MLALNSTAIGWVIFVVITVVTAVSSKHAESDLLFASSDSAE